MIDSKDKEQSTTVVSAYTNGPRETEKTIL